MRDADGALVTQSIVATVLDPIPAVQPLKSAQMAQLGDVVYVVHPDNDSIAAIDLRGELPERLLDVIHLPAGANPRSIDVDAAGRLWVTAAARPSVSDRSRHACHGGAGDRLRDGTLRHLVQSR